mgnify:CR=1 FL=1
MPTPSDTAPRTAPFADDQPRDDHGRWAATGSGGDAPAAKPGARPVADPLPAAAVRALSRPEAAARTGLSEGQLAGFRSVVSVDEFVKTPPPGLADAILLGKTRNQPHNLYWHLAATHGLQPWTKTYPQSLGPRYRDHVDAPDCTRRFMDGLFSQPSLKDKPIVFLCPTNILKPGQGKYTRQEMEYLLADPERAKRVVLVAGTDDYIDPAAVTASGGTARQRFDRVRATLDARSPRPAAPTEQPVPETHPAEFDDALFEWDADQPRDDHGRFAPVGSAGPAAAGPVAPSPPGVEARLGAATAAWSPTLDEYERGVVEFYTESLYKTLNKSLRDSPDLAGLTEGTRANAVALDAAIRKFPPHPEPVTTFRGVRASTPEKAAAVAAALDAAIATGDPLTLDGFTSASICPFVARAWTNCDLLMEVRSRAGAYLGAASTRPDEKEMLFTHGQRFRVIGVADRPLRTSGGHEFPPQRVYTLETVGDPPPPLSERVGFAGDQPRDDHGRWAATGSTGSAGAAPAAPVEVMDPVYTGPRAFVDASDAYLDTLKAEDVAAIKKYTASYYYQINTVVRGTAAADPVLSRLKRTVENHRQTAARLAAVLENAPVSPTPVTSYRGVRSRSPEKLARLKAGFEAALASGEPVAMSGFSSASINPLVAGVWTPAAGFVLEVKARRGLYVARASDAPHEQEVLHNHGATFRVTGVRTVGYRRPPLGTIDPGDPGETHERTTFTLEEVEPTPAAGAVHTSAAAVAPAGGAGVAEKPEKARRPRKPKPPPPIDTYDLSKRLAASPPPADPKTPAEATAHAAFRADCDALAAAWVARAWLPDKQKVAYSAGLTQCFRGMPPAAVARVLTNLGHNAPTFHPDANAVTNEMRQWGGRVKPGHVIAGFWLFGESSPTDQGNLHLDGGSDTDPVLRQPSSWQRGGGCADFYAHELGHALDGHETHSRSPDWVAAWREEIDRDGDPLTKYARTDSVEGFAEFHRLLLTEPDTARTAYPRCHAFFAGKGFA